MSYEQPTEPALQSDDFAGHKDLFETISEAHYLPALSGPHDEALLESLVEKGCEDNQILGQALDKLAHLVNGSGEYGDEEEDMLLSGAPVSDIIERLEQSLESPGRNSITAAQGLLNLQHMPTLHDHTEPISYEEHTEGILEPETEAPDLVYTAPVPENPEDYHEKQPEEDHPALSLPDQSDLELPSEIKDEVCDNISDQVLNMPAETDNQVELNNTVQCENVVEPDVATIDFEKELQAVKSEEMLPTDLSIKHAEETTPLVVTETANVIEDNISEKSDEQPRDLSLHRRLPTPHASPRRIDIPRAPSRESDAMQSPQPSGIPAVPSSPELFTMPQTKSKQTLFLETLLSSPSPKMYTSEVTITKQQCEPLNLGKHRKSASPTVSSCSDEIRKLTKDFGEPQEKRIRRESTEELAKISKVFNKSDDQASEKPKKTQRSNKPTDEHSAVKQLQALKTNPDFNIPDPMLVPKNKMADIVTAPGREIPALLIERPELRLPEAFSYPAVLQDPDILVISLAQLEKIIENHEKQKNEELAANKTPTSKTTEPSQSNKPDQSSQPKPLPSMDGLAGDIDAATSAALNQMLWLPYFSQLEAAMACSQNMDFIKAFNSSGFSGSNYPDLTQMFNHSSRFMNPSGFPMMPSMDYESRLQFAMWQEAMNHANAASRSKKSNSAEAQMKELSKSADVQNPYVHSTKNHQGKAHSAARTSPIAHNYNNPCQRGPMSHPFLQGMYPGMNPNVRPNVPLPGLQINPYFTPNMMASQRSPRTSQQKSPTSPYFQNNNYLQSVKQSEQSSHQRSSSTSSQESPRPRISVKNLQNLLEPAAAAASGIGGSRRHSSSSVSVGGLSRRRDEPEVGSTTPLGETPPQMQMPPHPHDPIHHLWHPLFGK